MHSLDEKKQIILIEGIANFKPARQGFTEKGFVVTPVSYNPEKISKMAEETPSIIVTLYFNDSVFELARVTNCPVVVWLVDKVLVQDSRTLGIDLSRFFVFSFDPSDAEAFLRAGFTNSWHLPCSSGFEYSSLKKTPKEYIYDVSFVGESITVKHNPYFQFLLNYSKLVEHISSVVEHQVSDFTKNSLLEAYSTTYSDQFSVQYMVDFLRLLDKRELDFVLGCEASSRLRKKLLRGLGGVDLHIFGDELWADVKAENIQLHREISYPHQTAEVYSRSKINLNISRVFFSGVIQRVFDIIYCHGFCITDFRADIFGCFEPDQEIVFYKNASELKEKVRYYLDKPEERERIASNGYKRLMKEHRAIHRIEFILEKLSSATKVSS
ncbi:MAG: glycosyltransferase [Nitrospinota bacterium]